MNISFNGYGFVKTAPKRCFFDRK